MYIYPFKVNVNFFCFSLTGMEKKVFTRSVAVNHGPEAGLITFSKDTTSGAAVSMGLPFVEFAVVLFFFFFLFRCATQHVGSAPTRD